ncbi:MAG: hypothetical protein GF329_22280, partial [Candidatus Lokiarchaeota archaeon]|nr:hypothetical protein [Candidatus Lokiarchaeota archaeon]
MSNLILPFFIIHIPNGSANWLPEGTQSSFSNPGFSNINPSIACDSNGVLYYTYTRIQTDSNDYEVVIYNNSAGNEFIVDYIPLSEGLSTNSINSTDNDNSEVFIESNDDEIHAVWQGKDSSSGTDYEIYYTNSSISLLQDVIDITDDAGESTDPSIVVVNDYVFISYYDSGTGDVRLKTNYDGNSLTGTAINATTVASASNPELSIWTNENQTEWRVDLAFIDSSGSLRRTYITNGTTGIQTAFQNNEITCTQTSSVSDLSIASSKDLTIINYIENNDVLITNSTDFTNSRSITSGNGYNEGDPDVIINDNGLISIFFVRNRSASESVIMTASNYGNDYIELEPIITKDQVPNSNTGLHISSFDVGTCPGEGVFIMYDSSIDDGGYQPFVLYYNNWAQFYNDGMGVYNYYAIYEDLQGQVYPSGWLIEGIQISYNTTSGNPFDLKIRLTDTVTNTTWENTTTISENGGEDYKISIFQPGDYFIARNPLILELTNGSNQKELIKIDLDPLAFSENGTTSISNSGNETLPYYINQLGGTGFEGTLFYYDFSDFSGESDNDYMWVRDTVGISSPSSKSFDSDDHVDMYKFRMNAGEQYNMSLSATGSGSENCRLMIFNSTTQITSLDNALYTINTSTNNGTYFTLYSSEEDTDYYVVIENTQFGATYNYVFEHQVCPMAVDLLNPEKDGEYI